MVKKKVQTPKKAKRKGKTYLISVTGARTVFVHVCDLSGHNV